MRIVTHIINQDHIAELFSDEFIIGSIEDGVNIVGDMYYQGFDKVIIHENNILPEFFDLKSRIAGEILQKFSTYRVRLAIVGDFTKFPGKSLSDFIAESNKGKHINFVSSSEEAIRVLSH